MKNANSATPVATVNGQKILIIFKDGEKLVAIKPICEALGVDYSAQLQRLKSDDFLNSTMGLSPTVGADGKQREMVIIPFRYVFGWLFRIDSRNVKEESRQAVLTYQKQCYDALYNYFTGYEEFYNKKEKMIAEQKEIYSDARRNFYSAKTLMKNTYEQLEEAIDMSYEEFVAQTRQTQLNFSNHTN